MSVLGMCECGCGLPTIPIAKTSTRQGRIKGQPNRFLRGHPSKNQATTTYKYIRINGALLKVHRLRAATALGKPLPPRAVVHHADGAMRHDAPLVICEDQAYHLLLHYRMSVVRAGGNPNTQKQCCTCRRILDFAKFGRNRAKRDGLRKQCQECRRAQNRKAAPMEHRDPSSFAGLSAPRLVVD